MTNKFASYDKATQKLMLKALEFDLCANTQFTLPETIFLLRESFKNPKTYKTVFDGLIPDCKEPSAGFCRVSSYYIYQKFGSEKNWDIMSTATHWWLVYKNTGEVFDITYTQFSKAFPYNTGKKTIPDNLILQKQALLLGKCARTEL